MENLTESEVQLSKVTEILLSKIDLIETKEDILSAFSEYTASQSFALYSEAKKESISYSF
jgi:predicted HTH domain antitoxin